MDFYVDPAGSDADPGTADKPFRTVQTGIAALEAGDVLTLRTGNYLGPVRVEGKRGTRERPIVIRSARGAHVTLDGCFPGFRSVVNDEWEPALRFDPVANEEEYVSRAVFGNSGEDRVFRGAFLQREPYTRLITYARLADLRARNQKWDKFDPVSEDPPGPVVVPPPNCAPFRRPWVYMGPGIFVSDRPPTAGRIHIRLSHTANRVPGLTDYLEEIDPRKVPLAISSGEMPALIVRNSRFVRFERLTMRFGGDTTVRIRSSQDIVLDHVRILAAAQAISIGETARAVIRHCEIRGGLPGWFFRSDRKGEYEFMEGGVLHKNVLGKQTSSALIGCPGKNVDLEIHHCEIRDGHDLQLSGIGVRFHHNWVHNLNDEALIVDARSTEDLHIFQNVITQCLSGLSFAGRLFPGGRRFVCRNLFDLRSPTASRRPAREDDPTVMRFGHLYKGGGLDGPLDLFQNTFLVRSVTDRHASYTHYENDGNTSGLHPRQSFNNIFVAVNPNTASDKPIVLLPSPDFPGPTDGNCYFRIRNARSPLLRFTEQETFEDLEALWCSDFFAASQARYPPGFEASSIEVDPRFRRIAADGAPQPDDDLRLRTDSRLGKRGIELDPELQLRDPLPPQRGSPDIGCYRLGGPPLRVGVGGRKRFPAL